MRLKGLAVVAGLNVVAAFTTDYFYQICNAIVVSNDSLDRCTNGTEVASALTDSQKRCLFDDLNYLQSIYACVVKAGDMAGVEDAAELSWGALNSACFNYTDKPALFTFAEMTAINTRNPVTAQFELVAALDEQVPFTCPDSMLSPNVIKAGVAYNTNIYASNVYGFGTVIYVAAIVLVQCALNLAKWLVPRVYQRSMSSKMLKSARTHLTIPAMWGFKRAVPVKLPLNFGIQQGPISELSWDLAFPPRLHCFLLVGYCILCLTLLFVRYDFVTSEFSYTTRVEAITKLVGYRSGYFAMYKLPILVLFASKNNLLMWATGWGYDVFNHWHRALGRLFLVDIIIHAGCYTRWGQWAGVYLLKWQTFPPWIAAQSATLAVGLMCLFGNKTFRSKFYDIFRAMHVVLAVVVMVGTYAHISYFHLALKPLYIAVLIWAVDRVCRGARVVWSGLFAGASIEAFPDDILKVELHHRGWTPRGGSYVFIHFLRGFECLNPHPFSAVQVNNKTQLYIKARTGRTAGVLRNVQQAGGRLTMPVWLEGPYGHDFDKKNFREIVFVAGGVGITGVFGHLAAACTNTPAASAATSATEKPEPESAQNFYVYWVVPDLSWLDTFAELVDFMESDVRIFLTVHVTRSSGMPVHAPKTGKVASGLVIEIGRPNLRGIVSEHISSSIASTCFFACGPPIMCDTVRAQVAEDITLTRNYVEFNEECFSM